MTEYLGEDTYEADRCWIAEQTGGEVARFERIGGGGQRTTFLVDVSLPNGRTRQLVFQRAAAGPYAGTSLSSLPREASVYRELSARGFPIPPFIGLTPDRKGLLSERITGEDNYFDLADPTQRAAVTKDVIRKLAWLHEFNPSDLALEDLPDDSEPNQARARVQLWQSLFDQYVRRPAPVVRFALQWMARNAPENREYPVLCHGDTGPGNFLFSGNEVTAFLDWELMHLGDRHADLGMLALRGYQMAGMGDLSEDLAYYEKVSGVPVDRERVAYFRVVAILLGVVTSLTALDRDQVGRVALPLYFHLVPYLQHLLVSALVEFTGIEVSEPEIGSGNPEPPEAEVLAAIKEELEDESRHPASSMNAPGLKELTAHVQARARYGEAVDTAELDDLQKLLGSRPESVRVGLQLLDQRLLQKDLNDAELLRWSHRHTRRQAILWPAWAERYNTPLLEIE